MAEEKDEIPGEEILDELLLLSHRLGDAKRDWVMPGEGCASIRLDDSTFAMTADGASLVSLKPCDLVTLSFSPLMDAVLAEAAPSPAQIEELLLTARCDQSRAQPSEEAFLHAYLLTLPDVLLVGHTKGESIAGLLCSERGWDALRQGGRLTPDEVVHCGVAPCSVPFASPGIELARAVRKQVEVYLRTYQCSPKTIYLQNQGFIALGGLASEVERTTAVADKAARILGRALMAGAPSFLAPEVAASIAQTEPIRVAAPAPAPAPLDIAAKEAPTEPAPEPIEDDGHPGEDIDAAIARYRRIIAARPKNAKAHYNLGLALLSRGKIEESIVALRQAVKLKPKDIDALVNLGVALAHKEAWDEAIGQLDTALALAPEDASIHYNLGQTYLSMDQPQEAIALLKESIRLDPADPDAHLGLANSFYACGWLDEAMGEYRESLNRDSQSAEAHYKLAICLTRRARLAEAVPYYRDAAKLDPKNAGAHVGLGDAHRADKRYDDAIGEYQEALFLEPEHVEAYYGFGCALYEKGAQSKSPEYFETAKDAFGRALTISPHHAPSLTGLASIEAREGNNEAAAAALNAAIEADPDYTPAIEALAKLQMQMGKWRDAWRTKRSSPARREKKSAVR